jgi:hypothetical protein
VALDRIDGVSRVEFAAGLGFFSDQDLAALFEGHHRRKENTVSCGQRSGFASTHGGHDRVGRAEIHSNDRSSRHASFVSH